jgi:hypothetical protein
MHNYSAMLQSRRHCLICVLLALLMLASASDLCAGDSADHQESLPVTAPQGAPVCPCPSGSEAPQRGANCSCSIEASVPTPDSNRSEKSSKRTGRRLAGSTARHLAASHGLSAANNLEAVSSSVTYRQTIVLRI